MTVSSSDRLRIVLTGSTEVSRVILQTLLRYRGNVVGVFGLGIDRSAGVSAYARFDDLAARHGIPYQDFANINAPETVHWIRDLRPDLLFVVGLSQLVGSELLAVPTLGCVGFHPTRLPEGRGRAPIPWLILENRPGAATFFLMDAGADSGPILAQAPFEVSEEDYASDVHKRMEEAIVKALADWLPRLLVGNWTPEPQDHERATYYGKRNPQDGLIDWTRPAREIHVLVRAVSRPYPGTYAYVGSTRLVVWRAELEPSMPYHGVVGRILEVNDQGWPLVQTGDGLLWLSEVEVSGASSDQVQRLLRVGRQLGYRCQDEVFALRSQVQTLQQEVESLTSAIARMEGQR